MNKKLLLAVGLALVIAVAGLAGCGQQGSVALGETASGLRLSLNNQQEGIWVNGSGKVSAVPDIAILRLGIEAQEASVAYAQEQANQAMNAVKSVLDSSGIDEKDIQTQYFNIQRVTRWDEREGREVVIGYRVTNMVMVKIREMGKVGAIIDAVATAGGDLTRIDGISFTVDDPSAYLDQARAKAMADAASKAEQLAEMAGVELGKATYIVESTAYPYPVYRQDLYEGVAAAPAMETPISPGEMEISVNVQVAYAILN
ncbi:MAG TPA: SIMPL domain-containing protein [Dehalococcoidia bacterium]|nr:SIMPL domain-containing protein [Dehalococcoidia bacterium]